MDFTCIFFGLVFILYGFFLAFCRGYKHLSVWKKMTAEEKTKIKISSLCKNIGEIIMLSGIIFLMKGFCENFSENWFMGTFIAWFIVAGLDVLYISKSKRYIKK